MSEGFVIINALSHFLRSFLPPNQEDERRASEGEKKRGETNKESVQEHRHTRKREYCNYIYEKRKPYYNQFEAPNRRGSGAKNKGNVQQKKKAFRLAARTTLFKLQASFSSHPRLFGDGHTHARTKHSLLALNEQK